MLDGKKQLNRSVPVPLYYQLKELILSEIKSGDYKSGDVIPTEKEISSLYELSRTTVRQAVSELVQDGWLYRVKSKGTFVGHPKIHQSFIKKVESFNHTIERQGLTPSTRVMALETQSASQLPYAVVNGLGLTEKDEVVYLYRLRMANDDPIVIVSTYLPHKFCGFLLNHDLNQEQLYSALSQRDNTKIYRIERTVEAVLATAQDAQLLNIKRGAPIQLFTSIGYNQYGVPIEYTISRYRGDQNKFEVTVFPEDQD